jgi:hypothetical protein
MPSALWKINCDVEQYKQDGDEERMLQSIYCTCREHLREIADKKQKDKE